MNIHRRRVFTRSSILIVALMVTVPTEAVDLVQGGRPVATIILPTQPLPVETYAAQELQYHVEVATGARLLVLSEVKDIPAGVHIYLGRCQAAREAKLDPSDLPGNGYLLKTIGNDLFISGHDAPGDPLGTPTSARNGATNSST